MGPNLVLIRTRAGIEPLLIVNYIRHPEIQTDLLSEFAGSATPGFTVERLRRLPITLPSGSIDSDLSALVRLTEARIDRLNQMADVERAMVEELVFDRLSGRAQDG